MALLNPIVEDWEPARGNMAQLLLENLFPEQAPTETGVVLQSRPPLIDRGFDMGAGPVNALFQRDGVISGALLGVSGRTFYQGTSAIGTINGSGPLGIDGNEIGAMVAGGGALKFYDGATLATVTTPDSFLTTKVLVAASRFVALRAGSGKYYWTEPLGSTFDALAFATAEAAPDQLLDALFVDNMLTLFGKETVEFAQAGGTTDLPFTPLPGRAYPVGIKNTGAACKYANSFAWVGSDNVVYMPGQAPQRISPVWMGEKIKASAEAKLFTYRVDGIEFLCLKLDADCFARSAETGLWSRNTSYGQTNFIPSCWANGVFGSGIDGRTLEFGAGHLELGGELMRRFCAGYPINGGGVRVNNIGIRCDAGNSPYLTGDYVEPLVSLETSLDSRTFDAPKPRSMGANGRYRKLVQWRNLGTFGQPGLLARFTIADPTPLRVSAVTINEPYGGR